MQDSEVRQMDRDHRVREFIANSASFAAGSRGAELAAALDTAITEAEEQAAKQDAATLDRQESTEQKNAAINTLLEHLRAINRTARSIDQQMPGFADQFRMPSDSDQAVINRARAFIAAATPVSVEFTKRDLPATFLTDLQTAIAAVDEAEDRQSAALANQTAATAALNAALKTLRDLVRELDAIIRNKFGKDPGALAAWKSASSIEAAPKKKKDAPPPPPPAT